MLFEGNFKNLKSTFIKNKKNNAIFLVHFAKTIGKV